MVIARVIMATAVFIEVFSAAYALFIVYVSADGLADVPCANYVKMMIMLLLLLYVKRRILC